jgi:hypothetical protein
MVSRGDAAIGGHVVSQPHATGAALAKEASAKREGQYVWYGRAPSAKHPAASVVNLWRSPASPGGSQR